MRFLRRFFALLFLVFLIGSSAFLLWMSDHYTVPIMMYHHVDHTFKPRLDTVSPENFERHMEFLAQHHYRVISLDELIRGINNGKVFPRNTVVITFDDGYLDNYTNAFEILKRYQFPATIFVPSDDIDTKEHLSWDQLKEMQAHNITIGSHTRTHAYLPDLFMIDQKKEIEGSKQILEEKLKTEIAYFAYPIGGFNDQIKQLLKDAGYKAACTTNRGFKRTNKDIFELKRVRFSDAD